MPAEIRGRLKVSAAARSGAPAGQVRAWVNQVCGVQDTTSEGTAGASAQR
jgi:hypothetical protein